jgi:hypothetical protein
MTKAAKLLKEAISKIILGALHCFFYSTQKMQAENKLE